MCAAQAMSDGYDAAGAQERGMMSERILVVEDDPRLAGMLDEYLRNHGYAVSQAATGAQALEQLGADALGAVILDLMLPDMDGLDVCRKLREQSDLPVLMLTARGDAIDRIVGLELGADDYLPKPFEPRELLARLRAILRRRATPASGATKTLLFGQLEIDPNAHTVKVAGRAAELTAYQFELLLALAQRAGRVLSRDMLMDLVRGAPLDAFDRSIDVHISRIRAAIEDDPKSPRRIITVRGAGYLFARKQD